MKSRIMWILLATVLFAGTVVKAQDNKTKKGIETITFKVYGNCSQCKGRIEEAMDTKGVKFAEWNVDSKQLTVKYNPEKITVEQLHEKVASVGHDTDLKKAKDEVYRELPDCCLYREKPNTHHD